LAGKAESTLQSSQDANRDALAEVHTDRMAPAAPAARSASAASATSAASAASPFLESHAVMGAVMPQSALSSSVVSGNASRVRVLLDEGANPEQSDSLGRTPLLLAVIAHRADLVELLLAHHANPNVSDSSGQTPLQRARLDAQLNIVQLLERAGAH
jgi:ankyrin repeat protein